MFEKFLERRDDLPIETLARNAKLLYAGFLFSWFAAMGMIVITLFLDANPASVLIVALVSVMNLVLAHDVRREYWRRKDAA